MDNSQKLAACHLCGSVAGIGKSDTGRWYIECASPSCNLTLQPLVNWKREYVIERWNTRADARPRTTGDSDLVERFARAMFEEWPLTAISPAIAERSGLPEGTVLTYDKVLEMGGNHDGLLRLAKGAAKLHTAIEATLSTQAAEIERWKRLLGNALSIIESGGCEVTRLEYGMIGEIRQALSDTSGSATAAIAWRK